MLAKNVGTIDRVARVILGLGLLSLVVALESPVRWVGLLGLVLLGTAAMSTCPIYSVLGMSTCPVEGKKA